MANTNQPAALHDCIECNTTHCNATAMCESVCLEDHAVEPEPTGRTWDANFEYRCDSEGVWS